MDKMFVRWAILGLCVVMVTIVSCGGGKTLVFYDGEQRPQHEVAIIDVSNPRVYVMGIDTLDRKYQALSAKFIEVLPGKHKLKVAYKSWKGRAASPIELEFQAKAGHNYIVKAAAGFRQWSAWIEDKSNGTVVAGIRK